MKGPVVVGVDGSPESRSALSYAVELASALDATLIAVHAVGLLEPIGPDGQRAPASGHIEEVRHIFETEWCEPLRATPIEHRTELGYGTPAEVVLDTARRHGAGLIVVGSRGVGRSSGGLGSSSARVARESEVPVVVVPGGRG